MEGAINELDAVEERRWSRHGAVRRAMAERHRCFTVRLDLTDEMPVAADEDGQPEAP